MRKVPCRAGLLTLLILLAVILSACGGSAVSADVQTPVEAETVYSVKLKNAAAGDIYTAEMRSGDKIVIGRLSTSDFVISGDPYVSRTHCRLVMENGTLYLEDLDSTNGTFILSDGQWTRISERVPLQAGDQIRMGTQILTLESLEDQA